MRFGRDILIRLSGFFTVAAVWQLASNIRASPALPSPVIVLRTILHLIRDGTFTRHIGASLSIVLLGVCAAAMIGLTIGILLFRYDRLRTAALPVIESIRGIAALTFFPLLIVLFGLGVFPRVFIIFWTAWPAIVLSVLQSLVVDTDILNAARTSGADEWRILYSIRIPIAAPGIITGLRIGIGGGWVSLIAAEMLGASKGLGYYLLWCSQSFEFDKVYATIIAIAALGGLMNYALLLLQKRTDNITGGFQ